MPKLSFSTRDSAIFAEKAEKSSVFSPQIFCPLTDPYQIWWVGRYWGDTSMVEKAKTSPGNFASWAWPNEFLTLSGAPTSPLSFRLSTRQTFLVLRPPDLSNDAKYVGDFDRFRGAASRIFWLREFDNPGLTIWLWSDLRRLMMRDGLAAAMESGRLNKRATASRLTAWCKLPHEYALGTQFFRVFEKCPIFRNFVLSNRWRFFENSWTGL